MSDTLTVRWHGGDQRFEPGATVRIGRDPGCDVTLDNPNVSRVHLVIEHDGHDWVARDGGSAQGSYAAGQRITQLRLERHQELVLGAPRVGQHVEVTTGTDAPTNVRTGTAAVAESEARVTGAPADPAARTASDGVATVVPGRGRPGGDLRRDAFDSSTVLPGISLRVDCGGHTYTFRPSPQIVVGRDPDADVVTANPAVSRRHAVLAHDGEGWRIEDEGSQGGIWVDGSRTSTHRLSGTTTVWLGDPHAGERLEIATGDTAPTRTSGRTLRLPRPTGTTAIVGGAAALVAVVLLVVLLLRPAGGTSLDQLARSTVSLQTSEGVRGSGTVIDAEQGLVLTNAHVVAPRAPGQGVITGGTEASLPQGSRLVTVSVSDGVDRPAEPKYRAEVVAADGYLDLAVIRITQTLTGSLIERGDLDDLVAVRLGASDGLGSGDRIRILGHPTAAQSTAATLTEGVVSGVVPDPRLGSNRAYYNLDAVVRPGNSGGLVADEGGRFVGVPTLNWVRSGSTPVAAMRPIGLALPLVEAARAGEEYESPHVTPPTGNEEISSVGFGRLASEGWNATCDVPGARPTRADRAVGLLIDYRGFRADAHQDLWVGVWDVRAETYIGSVTTSDAWPIEFSGAGCVAVLLPLDKALPAGEYEIDFLVGPNYRRLDDSFSFRVAS